MIIKIPLRFSNAYLIKGRYPVLVDTGMPGDAPRLLLALQRHGVALRDIPLVLQTHGHVDHCGGTLSILQASGAQAVIHRADGPLLKKGTNGELVAHSLAGRLIKRLLPPSYPAVFSPVLYEEVLDLGAFGLEAQLIHTPGHTAGSSSVIFRDGTAIIGDLLMGGYLANCLFPRVALPHYFVQSAAQVRDSLGRLLEMGIQRFYPGHGGPLSRASVEQLLRRFPAAEPVEIRHGKPVLAEN